MNIYGSLSLARLFPLRKKDVQNDPITNSLSHVLLKYNPNFGVMRKKLPQSRIAHRYCMNTQTYFLCTVCAYMKKLYNYKVIK